MSAIDVTEENFRELYKNNDILVLDFWASWCGPCIGFAPVFESVAKKHKEIVFGKIETELQPKLSEYFSIRSIPTIIVIREELELFRHSGAVGEDQLEELVLKIKNLDMAEVKKKIAEEDAAVE